MTATYEGGDGVIMTGKSRGGNDGTIGTERAKGSEKAYIVFELSRREREVLSWMAKGYNNGAIAEELSVERQTIESHSNSIYSKFGLATDASKHFRVSVVLLYLRATGQLQPERAIGPEEIMDRVQAKKQEKTKRYERAIRNDETRGEL